MIRIWEEAFWKPAPESSAAVPNPLRRREKACLLLPVVLLTSLAVLLGLLAQPFFALAQEAANQLFQPSEYIRAVLESR